METLFKKYDISFTFIFIAILLRIAFGEMSWLSYFSIIISLHQFLLLFFSIGDIIPIRFLFGSFMCLQMLLGPVLAFNGLDQYQYPIFRMQVTETAYFSYAIPGVLMFITGLHVRAGYFKGEYIDVTVLQSYLDNKKNLPYIFIAIGFLSSIVSSFFSSELAFVLYLLGGLKFVGAFLLILNKDSLKALPIIFVSASIISSSLSAGMFHDLLIWSLFIGAVFCLKYKPTVAVKLVFCIAFLFVAVMVQQLKSGYRTATKFEGKEAGIKTYVNVLKVQKEKGFFSFQSLGPHNVRINQGFIITYIMNTVPQKVPFSNGQELYSILEAAFLPRFLAPNKLNAGDRTIFMAYTGLTLSEGTSMGLSSLGDAYINFGLFGGCIFMFVLGLVYSEILIFFGKYYQTFPILILFAILVFYFPIRPDTELQTLLGHLVKSCVVVFFILRVWKEYFSFNPEKE
ncbi:MAG: hypothetical protein JWQ96_977 [Segetibacter sp.]|nr:hypothetical protein [Segetibacter sp.]